MDDVQQFLERAAATVIAITRSEALDGLAEVTGVALPPRDVLDAAQQPNAKGKVMPVILPGETIRADCDNCGSEFAVTYEPKATTRETRKGIKPSELNHCPLCGSDSIVTDADDNDDSTE